MPVGYSPRIIVFSRTDSISATSVGEAKNELVEVGAEVRLNNCLI